jgi:hypothetical protein
MEPQFGAGLPENTPDYSFILNPNQQKRGFGIGFIKDPFIAKIVLIVGCALALMLVMWLIVTLAFSSKTDIDTFVSLAQREEEILRVSAMGRDAIGQQVKNAATNTQLSIRSYQNKTIAYLTGHGRKLKLEELTLKKDATVDGKLKQAKETSAFDAAFTSVMRAQLMAYAEELKRAFDNESDGSLRLELAKKYEGVQLLLKQWPESSS